MISCRFAFVLALEIASVAILSGCVAFDEFDEGAGEEVAIAEQPIITTNSLTTSALTTNALIADNPTISALISKPLTTAALNANSTVLGALGDAAARDLFSYVVGCALPLGAHVDVALDGGTYGFDGQIGLAPQWGNAGGNCDNQCRQWVSACVISRVNYLGLPVLISDRGSKAALAVSASEAIDYTEREAAYFGDIFAKPQSLFACLSPGKVSIPRVCGPSIGACDIEVIGWCDNACSSVNPSTGAYANCRESPADPWFPAITVYLDQ
jgi:hypothetical protein